MLRMDVHNLPDVFFFEVVVVELVVVVDRTDLIDVHKLRRESVLWGGCALWVDSDSKAVWAVSSVGRGLGTRRVVGTTRWVCRGGWLGRQVLEGLVRDRGEASKEASVVSTVAEACCP